MENVRRGDESPSPPITADLAALPNRGDPLLLTPNEGKFGPDDPAWTSKPPPAANSQFADNPSSQPKPLFQGFERPNFSRIAILTVLCLITYPAFYILTLVAKDRSLFIVRLIVAVWCSGAGFSLGNTLLKIGARHLEAASEFTPVLTRLSKTLFHTAWAAVIHMSYSGGGMKLRDLARSSSSPTGLMPAFHTLWSLFSNGEASRDSRKSYESVHRFSTAPHLLTLQQQATVVPQAVLGILRRSYHSGCPATFPVRTHHGNRNFRKRTCHRPASLYLLIFEQNQRKVYREVLIAADLSSQDEDRAGNICEPVVVNERAGFV